MIRVGLPKGRFLGESQRLCSALGVDIEPGVLRYATAVDDMPLAIYLMKSPDVARMLKEHRIDLGLTGDEWLMEAGVRREFWCFDTGSYAASVCLLMADGDLRSVRMVRPVVTPYPNLTRALLRDVAPRFHVVAVAGSSEGLVPDFGDACLDLVETGSSAALNGLTVRETFGQVSSRLARSAMAPAVVVEPVIELLAAAVVRVP